MSVPFFVFGAAVGAFAGSLLLTTDHSDMGAFALSLGLVICVLPLVQPRADASRATVRRFLALSVGAFAAARAGTLALTSALGAGDVPLILLETVLVAGGLHLALARLHGIDRLALELSEIGEHRGYARVLPAHEAAFMIDAELARSRRREEPLVLVVLTQERHQPEVRDDLYASSRAIGALEGIYLRSRLCQLLSDEARRSDIVVCGSDDRFVVMTPGTDTIGAVAFVKRTRARAAAELGVTLDAGTACFPSDGQTLDDLVAVAGTGPRRIIGGFERAELEPVERGQTPSAAAV